MSRERLPGAARPPAPGGLPDIFFCGDPHGRFDHINEAVARWRPAAIVLLGDLQPPAPLEEVLAESLALTEVWWIPGNHDSETEDYWRRLWRGPLAERNLHGRVVELAGLRIAGLGGVFRGQIWMPDGRPSYPSAESFRLRHGNPDGTPSELPRRHHTSIFPDDYERLRRQRADVLVTHEAPSCHRKGFAAIDRLGQSMRARWLFHGHQHEDQVYGEFKRMNARGVGYQAIVDLSGRVIAPALIDPRDAMALQRAGDEPAPETLDQSPILPSDLRPGQRRAVRPRRRGPRR